jgi:membrane protein implicated in regulation of membrane protease activity
MWSEHGDAINSAGFFVHVVAAVVNAAATALVSAAYEAASVRAPAVLSHLKGVIKEIRSQDGATSSPGFFKYRDMAPLVQTAAFLALITDLFVHTNALAGSLLPVWLPCLMVLRFTAVMVADNRGGPARTAELEVPESWRFLWFVMIVAYCVDACLLRLTLGPEPLEVAFLALCHVKVISVGKKVQRAPEDQGVNRGADRWRRTATALLAASVAKVAAIGVVLNVQLAALSLVALSITAVLLVMREEILSDLDASGGDIGVEEGAGFAADTIEGAEEETGQVRAEQSSTRRAEHDEEQRHEEWDHSSMYGWAFVEVDPADVDQS